MANHIRYFLIVYVIFVSSLLLLDLNDTTDLNIPSFPSVTGSSVLGNDLDTSIDEFQEYNILTYFIGGSIQLVSAFVGLIIFALISIFWILNICFIFTLPSNYGLNTILLLLRVLMIIDILPYIKNILHPTAGGTS